MEQTPGRIEIIAPFGEAVELTKNVLFRPFNLEKWCIIGLAAFLSHLGGGGGGFNFPSGGNWSSHSTSHHAGSSSDVFGGMPSWVIPVAIVAALVVIALIAALLWVGCRGRFMFVDCIVRNRAAIEEPWKEFRREGNSLFVFSVLAGLAMLLALVLCALPALIPLLAHGSSPTMTVGVIVAIALFVAVFLVILLAWGLISQFMVPVMYRRRCRAMVAFREVIALIIAHPGSFILYLLFGILLGIGTGMVTCIAIPFTCCLVMLPYVGTVILLPIYVCLTSFPLLFLRQFGPDYNVWGGALPIAAPPPSMPPIPPVQP